MPRLLVYEWLQIGNILITFLPSYLLAGLLQREISSSTIWLPSGAIYPGKAG